MYCEKCKKEIATVHLTEVIRNISSEIHLCEKCSKDIGLNSGLSGFSLSVSDMLSFLEIGEINGDEKILKKDETACAQCGCSFYTYRKEGKLGCQDCYKYLEDSLVSVISAYHGEKKHIGKIPELTAGIKGNSENARNRKEKREKFDNSNIDNLKIELERAVLEERYEDAAVLRDIINKS